MTLCSYFVHKSYIICHFARERQVIAMVHTAIQLSHIEESLHKILAEALATMDTSPGNPLLYDSLLEVANLTNVIEERRKLALHNASAQSLRLSVAPKPRKPRATPRLASAG